MIQMDSYLHFEKMSNFDLHPVGLSVSRLSPAKSTSSIDQYTHHHSKGDSAYSSFSGGSTAPDYPAHILADDLPTHGLHYADLKYVQGIYGPSILESGSKSMPQLYQSMEVITQQHQNHNGCYVKNSPVTSTSLPPPPPPPVRLDSFVTARKLDTSRLSQSPEGQCADNSTFRLQASNTDILAPSPEPAHGYRNSHQTNQRNHDLGDDTVSMPETILSRLPLQTGQCGNSRQTKDIQSEIQQNSSRSAYEVLVPDQQPTLNSWRVEQNMISGSVQHKGQFYFVTGVYKSCESSDPEAQSQSHVQEENQKSHNNIETIFENAQLRQSSCSDGPCGKHGFQEYKSTPEENTDFPSNAVVSHVGKTSPSVYHSKEDQQIINMDIGTHHTTNNPIFYCGPEQSFSTAPTPSNKLVTHLTADREPNMYQRKDDVHKLTRQPLTDVPTEKISKETTPLLYHLTGASRASLMNKTSTVTCNEPEWSKDQQKAETSISTGDSLHSKVSNKEKPNDFYLCSTLDDSFKKYYKEKIKDAQTKVLRETSFKRKDLQLSWPQRFERYTDERLSVKPSAPRVQDLLSKLEKPSQPHVPPFKEMSKEYIRNLSQEVKKGAEKDLVTQQNIAQPQVPRLGGRKRLTMEQKKLSRSEPEKLHELADGPTHMSCRSLGNENEEELLEYNHSEQSLVYTRLKMFETRGRAMSASSFSKSTLKHLQQKALMAYLERKTGNKVAEPQHPAPLVPNQLTASGRRSDPSPYIGSQKKLFRPRSASHIQDTIRNDRFTSAHSGHSRRSSWIARSAHPGKSASAEELLDEQEEPPAFRSRSTSTPPAFHRILKQLKSSAANDKDLPQPQIKVEEPAPVHKEYAASVPDQQRVRVVAPRGKSMEELSVSKIWKLKVLSKSSEQLHQPLGKHVMSDRDKSDFIQKQDHTQRNLEQKYAPVNSSEQNSHVNPVYLFSEAPCSSHHTSAALHPGVGPPSGLESSVVSNHAPSYDEEPPVMLHGSVNAKQGMDPATPRGTNDNNLVFSNIKAVSQGTFKGPHDVSEEQRCNSDHEVSLSHGVTTDPSLWPLAPENTVCIASQSTTAAQSESTQPPQSGEIGTALTHSACDTASQFPSKEAEKKAEANPPGDKSEWERLVQEVVSEDQSLTRILYPITNRKTAVMLMEQLLCEDTLLMEEHYKKKQEQKSAKPEQTTYSSSAQNDNSHPMTSQQHGLSSIGAHVTEKKRQLMAHIEQQLKCVEGLRTSLQGEEKENGVRGESIQALVHECCLPAERERYKQFIEDLERVINLLLCLSARLARVQNALSTADENMDSEEKQSLENRHRFLCKQRDDAKDLKDNLDRRERMVSTFLAKQLSQEQLQEYRRFIQCKASLLIRQKDLDEEQRLGEEQLESLLNSIPP